MYIGGWEVGYVTSGNIDTDPLAQPRAVAANPRKVMKHSSHLTLHLTLPPTPCGIKLLHPRAASLRPLPRCVTVSRSFSVPVPTEIFLPPLPLPLPPVCPLPEGLLLLITSPQQRNRRKKEGQCETSVSDSSLLALTQIQLGIGTGCLVCLLVCVCVCELIDEDQLFMECQAALHIPTLMFLDVCVCVWRRGKRCVRG